MEYSETLSLGPLAGSCLAVAQMRDIYNLDDVVARANKTTASDNANLMTTYTRMIERGPERFQVKPAGLPAMDALYESLPNFHEALDDVRRQLALCVDSGDALEIAPMLLLGPPGIGKTHFARAISGLLGTGFGFISMSSLTAGWILSGSSSQWKGARPGKVFETLVDGQFSNAVMVCDEIDKARTESAYDPLGSLYSLLEHDTASHFVDEFAEVPVDASQLIWVATANEDRYIPGPILDRMNVYEIDIPDAVAARRIAIELYSEIRNEHGWGKHFDDDPSSPVLDVIVELGPRAMRRAWLVGFGNAKLARRSTILVSDLPATSAKKRVLGFLS